MQISTPLFGGMGDELSELDCCGASCCLMCLEGGKAYGEPQCEKCQLDLYNGDPPSCNHCRMISKPHWTCDAGDYCPLSNLLNDYVVTPGHKSVTLSDRLADPIIRFYSLLVTGAFAISDQYFRYS